jgi:predicted secreted Zn-dependent protease
MTRFTASRFVSVLALAAFVLPAAAQAAEPGSDAVVVVSTSGQSPASLSHSVAVAASKVCGAVAQPATDAFDDCFSHAIADARTQLDDQVARNHTTSIALK